MNTINMLRKFVTKHPAASLFSRSQQRNDPALLPMLALAAMFLATTNLVHADTVFKESPPFAGHQRDYITLKARNSGFYVQIPEASTINGTPAIQWSNAESMHGQWEFLDIQGWNEVVFRNRWSRQCLDVTSKYPGPVVQNPCNGKTSQRWILYPADGPWMTIKNKWSGLDLNVSGAAIAIGAPLIQWPHSDGSAHAMFDMEVFQDVID